MGCVGETGSGVSVVRVWQTQDHGQKWSFLLVVLNLQFLSAQCYHTALPDTLIIAMKQCCMRQFNEQDIHCCHDDEKDPLNKDRQPEEHSYSQVPKCAWQNNVLRQGTGTVIMVGRSVQRNVCCWLHRTWHIPPTSKLEMQIQGNLVLSPRTQTCSRHDTTSHHILMSRYLNPLQLICTDFLSYKFCSSPSIQFQIYALLFAFVHLIQLSLFGQLCDPVITILQNFTVTLSSMEFFCKQIHYNKLWHCFISCVMLHFTL